MSAALPEIPRDEEMLGKIAEMDLALAEEALMRARASDERADFTGYSVEYRKLTRSCRLTIALRRRLLREAAEDAEAVRKAAPPPVRTPAEQVRIARRKEELFEAVGRVIWRESEGEECEMLFDTLRDWIHTKPLPQGFGEACLDDEVIAWCDMFHLRPSTAQAWRDLPPLEYEGDELDEPDDAGEHDRELESSA